MSGSNLLFVLTGSIAGYKACEAVSQLVQRGHRVRTVATESALRFIGPATLEGLTGTPVLTDLFAPGAALEHINLTRWADAVLVCPATANTINRLAAGLADDLTGALFLAHDRKKPWLVAPAMNPAMWAHPATQAAAEKLREWGVRFLPVGEGRTACGETGEGRLAEPADIIAVVEAALARPARRLRVLITSGGTAEPIDGVRVLTNTSTGRTGAGLADYFSGRGHDVVLLRARSAAAAPGCREETFLTFAELDAALTRLLGQERFDAIIHAAAVGDFGIEAVVVGDRAGPPGAAKLESGGAPVALRLRPNPKLVDSLRARSRNPVLQVVAFKLTNGATAAAAHEAVRTLFGHSGADWVVHNDLSERADGAEFPAQLHGPGGGPVVRCATRRELAELLEQRLMTTFLLPSTSAQPLHAALS
ncbi:bifunctional phosphopantothenoylcysteine decarboxylase/phosphopantothenate--cysteine ligase CoaBC [Opitutus sp. GAS368]|uniref:bifunctional phosphopantothenoylcysteine decarboxylase/phosphopantothenate--cysteine ligase CoaBC n=1 Tax=Opitutus sp. GAS368 TaxID=1882749 RepID=UPI00087A2351|nr:bifunctional phosphopantothenoylcysteine decarboxylase/phosphopantothenate--cysteine ligase CoaBC [Opitutus sp. GAS368]SDR67242.1 phosphopantothenoylcysteine decarboxylase / phosphopantothenate--cysteine ligase [Opitutus sp. GAS368]